MSPLQDTSAFHLSLYMMKCLVFPSIGLQLMITHTVRLHCSHILKQRTPKKDEQKSATNQNPVRVHDGVETMGDGDDRTVGEVLSDGLLDDAVCPEGRRF